MNKLMKKVFLIWVFTLLIIFSLAFYVKAADVTTALDASYKIDSNVEANELRYGITHYKDVGLSMTKGTEEFLPQSVNILNVPSKVGVKVVSWTLRTANGWTKATVKNTAKNFETLNPGWIVVAAVNGDFYDIKGLNALPYQPSGAMMANGDVIRPIASGTTIGYTNNGTSNSFIGGQNFKTTAHQLAIYNDKNEIIQNFTIDKLNEAPGENETSLYYTYPIINNGNKENIVKTTPTTNSYLVLNQEQGLAMTPNNFFGKGLITAINEETNLLLGQFAIITNNINVQNALALETKIRVQQDVIGDYAECDNIIGGGVNLVKDGNPVANSNRDRHPRTIVGKKADGTLVFVTVDGRQETSNMYGVIYDEMSAIMLHYGCNEAYNIDGGGSTTMIIREENKFRLVNSPSDSSERLNSNALLIVVPELKLNVSNVIDTKAKVSFSSLNHDVTFDDIIVNIDGQTKKMVNNEVVFDNLTPKTEYVVNYTYQMKYQGLESDNDGEPFIFKTGKVIPTLKTLSCEDVGDNYLINYHLIDDDDTIKQLYFKYGTEVAFLYSNKGTFSLEKTKLGSNKLHLTLISDLDASPNERINQEFEVPINVKTPPKPGGCNNQSYVYYLSSVIALSVGFYLIRKRK